MRCFADPFFLRKERMKNKNLTKKEIIDLTRNLATLIHAGVGTGDAFFMLAEDEEGEKKEMLLKASRDADNGMPLAEIFKEMGRLPEYVSALTGVGEESGRLEEALNAIAGHYEEEERMDWSLRTTLLYPAVMLIVMLGVILILITKVIPIFERVYADLGVNLANSAGILMGLENTVHFLMPIIAAILGVFAIFLALFAGVASFREKMRKLWMKSHGFKGFGAKLSAARFAEAFSMGIRSGLPASEAVALAGTVLDEIPQAKERCEKCENLLNEGMALAEALRKTELIPTAECKLLGFGLSGGNLDKVSIQVAERLAEEAERELTEKFGRVEPALVIITSVIIGYILVSVMLPLVNIMTAIN